MPTKISDYWTLGNAEQNQIKSAHPEAEIKSYRVVGNLNVQWQDEQSGHYHAHSIPVDVTVEAESKRQAAKKAAAGSKVYYPEDATVSWLNNGPVIQ